MQAQAQSHHCCSGLGFGFKLACILVEFCVRLLLSSLRPESCSHAEEQRLVELYREQQAARREQAAPDLSSVSPDPVSKEAANQVSLHLLAQQTASSSQFASGYTLDCQCLMYWLDACMQAYDCQHAPRERLGHW